MPDTTKDAKCWMCTGQTCLRCEPFQLRCDHDVIDRHNGYQCDDQLEANL